MQAGTKLLLVDGAAFLYSFANVLNTSTGICGGEYDVLAGEVRAFVANVRAVGLEPGMYVVLLSFCGLWLNGEHCSSFSCIL